MKGEKNVGEIRIENGVIVYYGSRAGQIRDGCAVIDPMFQVRELTEYLERQKDIRMIRIERGVYERLMNARSMEENQQALKKVRVWQLKPDVDIQMKFVPYDTLMRKFGPPDIENYEKVSRVLQIQMTWRIFLKNLTWTGHPDIPGILCR